MHKSFINQKLSSFRYDNIVRNLIPERMKEQGPDTYVAEYEKDLKVTIKVNCPQPEVMEWVVWFENTGSGNTLQISELYGLDVDLPVKPSDKAVWQSLRGDYCNGESFMPIEKDINDHSRFRVEPARGRSSQETGFPYFDLVFGETGLVCGIGWSGQWQLDVARGNGVISLKAGQQDCDFYLKPGETARSIRVVLMAGSSDPGQLRRNFRKMHRKYYSPAAYLGEDFEMPIAVQPFDRYYRTKPGFETEAAQLKCIEVAARCGGFNTFWLDAAWFRDGFPNGVGNYDFDSGFPDGLAAISKKAHENNMKFIVWFEPERVARGSDLFSERDGTSWLLSAKEKPDTRLFNLGDPDARQWLLKTLSDFIVDNGIDMYRQDFNMDPLIYWREADEEGRRGLTEMRHVEGLYWLWDSLIARFPGLLIDNCSSGGRRIDFETCRRSVPLWRSDTACFPDSEERPVATWQQNQTINLTRYLPYHAACSWFEDAYRFRSTETMGIACGFDLLKDDYDCAMASRPLEELRRIRKYWAGDFYAISDPTCDEDGWAAYQLRCEDAGFAMIFRRRASNVSKKRIKLFSLDPQAAYNVRISDEIFNIINENHAGLDLINGIEVEIPEKMSSVMLEYIKM